MAKFTPIDLDEQFKLNTLQMPDLLTAATFARQEAQTCSAKGDILSAEAATQKAKGLYRLYNVTARLALEKPHLFAHRYFEAAQQGHWDDADSYAIEAIKSEHADEALKIACAHQR
jgi:hypothetical protein